MLCLMGLQKSVPSLHAFVFSLVATSLQASLSSAASSISLNHSLSGSQTITSRGDKFVLGFFQPANTSSTNYYIAIWYKKIPQQTPVWVANRGTPIPDPALSELGISDDGNLVLLNQFKAPVWSTNVTSIASNSTVAEILDSGNLVLRAGSDPSKVFWQSFDHPTDTWLPGAKLGLNKVTGVIQRLTAWKNSEDPAPGIFSYEIDPKGYNQFFLLRNMTKQYWTSGYWDGEIFFNVPELRRGHYLNFEYISNATVNYFAYYLYGLLATSRLQIDPSGQIRMLTWLEETQQWIIDGSQPGKQCDVYTLCGPFGVCSDKSLPFCSCVKGFSEASPKDWDLGDRTQGCLRNTPLKCDYNASASSKNDKFFEMPGMSLPDNPHPLAVSSAEDCESACLNNCSCTGYSYSSGCSVWSGDLINLQQLADGSTGETLYVRLAASELPEPESKKRLVKEAIGGAVAGAFGCLVAVLVLIKWNQRRLVKEAIGGAVAGAFGCLVAVLVLIKWSQRRQRNISIKKLLDCNLVRFTYGDLQRMTNNFSEKLGGGGFGSVFKGLLPDSTAIAVKKFEGLLLQGEKLFRTEVSTIGTIQHVNLVRLRGFCSEGEKRLLIYDYMPNGSLDSYLSRSSSVVLSWKARYQIAIGAAKGLQYLHEKCRECIIHCDVKPENVLLDASLVPKLADFGLAKLLGRDFSRVLTTTRGTIGYLAPEWISGLPITAKADVYSYGMMLFEVISGRRNTEPSAEERVLYFPLLAARKVHAGDVLSLRDPRLQGNANMEELDRACKIACWCIQDDESNRPSMGQVVQVLEGVIEVKTPPIPRILQLSEESPESAGSISSLSSG